MEQTKDIVKKYDKPVTRTRFAYKEEKGKVIRTEKQITLTDCYILIKENGPQPTNKRPSIILS